MAKTIKKHRAMIQGKNVFTAQQRKAHNVLMYFAKEQLEKNPDRQSFTCDELALRKLISNGQRIMPDELKKNLKELMRILYEFNILEDERYKSWRAMVFLAEVDVNTEGVVEFTFPPTIRNNILTPEIFCPLDLEILAVLDSKYSIGIYEFCKDYIKVEMPKLEIATFKKLMGIEDKYPRMYDLKLNVLDVAMKEINDGTDININYEMFNSGKKITHIKFRAWKKENYEKPTKENTEKQKEAEEEQKKISDAEFLNEVLILIPEHEYLTQKETAELKDLTNKNGEEFVVSNIKYTNRQNYQNYFVYLRKAIAEDYAEKDRKINEMKTEERKTYEQKVKDEEAAANQRETQRKQAIRIYQTLPDEERETIEADAERELEKTEGIEAVKKLKIVYENMRLSKIVELVISKYLSK